MNCQEVMELMQRQLDDDLDESEKEVLMNHSRHCPDCAAMFERLKLLSAELTSLPKVMPNYSLVDAIMPQLERIELFGQSEAATETPSAVETTEIAPRLMKRERRFPSIRVMSGIIAAGIVAGLFLVTFKPGTAPDFSAILTADSSNDAAADTTAIKAPPDYMSKSAAADESAAISEVETETLDNKKLEVASKMDIPAEETRNSEPSSGGSDTDTDHTPAVAEQSESDVNGIAAGGGSDSSDGSTGSQGLESKVSGQQGESDYGIAATQPAVTSPNGKYSAQAEDFTIKVYAVIDHSLVHTSQRKNGKLANLSWTDDSSKLTYEVHVEKGAIEKYMIDLTTGEEQKAAH